jgi:glycerophosphoryl diester phosphodiesterase
MKNKKAKSFGYFFFMFTIVIATLLTPPSISAIDDTTIFGAHRGSSINYVENTLDAIKEAVNDDKYKFIEIDVQYTKDKKLIVYHDLTLTRFQKQGFKIKDLTYAQIIKLSRFNIPLYQEVIDIIGDKKLNIEIKSQGNLQDDKEIISFILEDTKLRGIQDNILFSSISDDVIMHISEEYPELKVGKIYLVTQNTFLPYDYFTKLVYDHVEEIGADYIMLHGANLRSFATLKKLKPADKTLVIWYFDDQMYVLDDKLW